MGEGKRERERPGGGKEREGENENLTNANIYRASKNKRRYINFLSLHQDSERPSCV